MSGVKRSVGALLVVLSLVGCGDDDLTGSNTLDPDLVRGTYDPTTLSFDVAGSVFGEYDILAALDRDPSTHFLVLSNDGTAQLAFLNPTSGQLEPANGTYRMLEDGVRIEFNNAGQPGLLLLPQILELTYDEETGTLTNRSEVAVGLARLISLVPELDGEPLSDPVPGVLAVVFTPR
jgi:hypothetical protein